MQHRNSLDNADDIDFAVDYPYAESVRFPYYSTCNLAKVHIVGYDFLRLANHFLPPAEFVFPCEPTHEQTRYYRCNPPMGDRTYELPDNVMKVKTRTLSSLPAIPLPNLTSDEAPERIDYRESQQKRWVKLYSNIDDLWWALMIERLYINGKFEEVNEHIRGFFYSLLRRERIENIMRVLSKEWYDNDDIDYWMTQIDSLHNVKLARERDIIESGNIMYIQRLRGAA